MTLNQFFLRHKRHKNACFTVLTFLKGRPGLTDIVGFTLLMNQDKVLASVMQRNALLDSLLKKRVA